MFYPALILLILVPILHPVTVGETKMPPAYKKTAQVVSVNVAEKPSTAVQYTSQPAVIETSAPELNVANSPHLEIQSDAPVVSAMPIIQPNGVQPHPDVDPITQQQPFQCGSADKQIALYEAEFASKSELKQTDEWTRYQELQVAYQQNCEQ